MSATESLPEATRARLTALGDVDLERMAAELWTAADALERRAKRFGDEPAKATLTHAETTVSLALAGKMGPEIRGIVDRRVDRFKVAERMTPAKAKADRPEAYWRLVEGSQRAIWRHRAIENGEMSKGQLQGLKARFQQRAAHDYLDDRRDPFAFDNEDDEAPL